MKPAQNSRTGWPATAVLVAVFLPGLALAPSLRGLELDNNIEVWLEKDDAGARRLAEFREFFAHQERVLISWQGSSLTDPRLESLARVLGGTRDEDGKRTGGIEHVASVDSPATLLDRIQRRKVESDEARRRLQGALIGPNGTVGLLVILSDTGRDDVPGALRAIREAASDVGIPGEDLHVGGECVTAAALDEEVRRATWNVTDPVARPPVFLLSGLFGLVASFVVLRSVRLGFVVLFAAALTALLATALLPTLGRTMNMVVIVMPTLLIVLTLSAAIHLVNYWRHAAHQRAADPIRESLRIGLLPCLLAAVTTGIGLLALTISPLAPIRDFGAFSSAGILLSLVVVLAAVPAMLRVLGLQAPAPRRFARPLWAKVAHWPIQHPRLILLGGLTVFVIGTCGLTRFRSEVKVIRYFPTHSRLVQDSRFIEDHVAGLAPVEVLIRFTGEAAGKLSFLERMEIVRGVQDDARAHADISGAISLADFQAATERPPNDASSFRKMGYAKRSHSSESRIKQGKVPDALRYFAVPGHPDGYDWSRRDPLDEVWRISAQALLLSDADYGELTDEVEQIAAARLTDLPGSSYTVTGSVPLFFRAQRALLESLIRSFLVAFGVIAVIMMIMLRSVRAGAVCIFPSLMPIGIVFGLMSWTGQVLDIGTMLTASVALGIAVDGTLHLLTWFRTAVADGRSRAEAVEFALQHCGPAMTQTTVVVGASLLFLYPAELLLISRFGWVMAALLCIALAASVFFLPVLLLGAPGRWIQRADERRRHRAKPERTSVQGPAWVRRRSASAAAAPAQSDAARD